MYFFAYTRHNMKNCKIFKHKANEHNFNAMHNQSVKIWNKKSCDSFEKILKIILNLVLP